MATALTEPPARTWRHARDARGAVVAEMCFVCRACPARAPVVRLPDPGGNADGGADAVYCASHRRGGAPACPVCHVPLGCGQSTCSTCCASPPGTVRENHLAWLRWCCWSWAKEGGLEFPGIDGLRLEAAEGAAAARAGLRPGEDAKAFLAEGRVVLRWGRMSEACAHGLLVHELTHFWVARAGGVRIPPGDAGEEVLCNAMAARALDDYHEWWRSADALTAPPVASARRGFLAMPGAAAAYAAVRRDGPLAAAEAFVRRWRQQHPYSGVYY